MEDIINMLEGFIDGVLGLIDFVVTMIEDLVYVISLTGEFVANIPDYFSWLPSVHVTMLISIFGIVVIYKVLGREG